LIIELACTEFNEKLLVLVIFFGGEKILNGPLSVLVLFLKKLDSNVGCLRGAQ